MSTLLETVASKSHYIGNHYDMLRYSDEGMSITSSTDLLFAPASPSPHTVDASLSSPEAPDSVTENPEPTNPNMQIDMDSDHTYDKVLDDDLERMVVLQI